ncbi:hypothetical protein E4198_11580 [Streptomyces sp. RKND-216]|uniref:hypothetical protein n=1 Tax=Streptomyces sp. RKND-216 TaxID=2562581 RepID=UPI00109DF8EF|nr:hypothetical protein [Streptomyces sp. RKND-216]THA25282.1 hypothetical protein E4198_11580 [Streptomyces sp. RKND-216]
MSEKTDQSAQDFGHQIEKALAGVDRPVVFGLSSVSQRVRTPPRRRWPNPSVIRKRKKTFGDRVFSFVVTPVYYLSDPIGTIYDWLVSRLSFWRKRALRGGWGSIAGSLLAAHKAATRRLLVSGQVGLHLVYVGELGSETGWSVTREKVRGVEHLEGEGGMPHKATLRFHFTDGSWGDLVVIGPAWQQLLSQFPATTDR